MTGSVVQRLGVLLLLLSVSTTNASWVDPDTPAASLAAVSHKGELYRLVFSDEFEQSGRTFHDGHDPRWTALNKDDDTNNPLHYYSHDSIQTTHGVLNLTTDFDPKHFDHNNITKFFRSGMLQGWNKFCFTGGVVEISTRLPGNPKVGGLWPAGTMYYMFLTCVTRTVLCGSLDDGELGSGEYVNSSHKMWPFSTNVL